MNLWIRNQDRDLLIPIHKPISQFCEGLFYEGNILGTYKTKERALEVLDEIQIKIAQNYSLISLMQKFTDVKGNEEKIGKLFKDMIYEMPE